MAQSKKSGSGVYLRVLYDYDYKGHDDQPVKIKSGEECLLLKKSTPEWWYVIRNGEKKPIYVPANYMEEIHKTVIKVENGPQSSNKMGPPTAPKPSRTAPAAPTPQPRVTKPAVKKKGPPPKPPAKPVVRKASDEEEVLKQLDNILEHAFDFNSVVEEEHDDASSSGTNSKSNSLQRGVELLSGAESSSSEPNSRTGSLQRGGNLENVQTDSKSGTVEKLSSSSANSKSPSGSLSKEERVTPDEPDPDYDEEDEGNSSPNTARDQRKDINSPNTELMGDSGISEGSMECLDKVTDSAENSLDRKNRKSRDLPDYENIGNITSFNKPPQADKDVEDDMPDYANIADIQAHIHVDPPPNQPPADSTPLETKNGWDRYKEPVTQRFYFYNPVTKTSTWIQPKGSNSSSENKENRDSVFTHDSPCKPPTGSKPIDTKNGWDMYLEPVTQRFYFYNPVTKSSTWIPPKNRHSLSENKEKNHDSVFTHGHDGHRLRELKTNSFGTPVILDETSYLESRSGKTLSAFLPLSSQDDSNLSEANQSHEKKEEEPFNLPEGWKEEKNEKGDTFFVNDLNTQTWRKNRDTSGKVYFYNEQTGDAKWKLPELHTLLKLHPQSSPKLALRHIVHIRHHHHLLNPKQRASWAPGDAYVPNLSGSLKSAGMPFINLAIPGMANSTKDLAEAHEDHEESRDKIVDTLEKKTDPTDFNTSRKFMRLQEKQGYMKVAKVLEHGKKSKKSWSQQYVYVKGGSVFIYKDQKSATPKVNLANGKPEGQLELHGAQVEFGKKDISSKKNVIQLTTKTDTQYLFQLDDTNKMNEWHAVFRENIDQISQPLGNSVPDLNDLRASFGNEDRKSDDSTSTLQSSKGKKSSSLTRNDAVFGSHLHRICDKDGCNIPHFVSNCINAIERRGLSTDGIYRISGNLAQIQKLRVAVDSGSPCNLDDPEWEINVLTGALKMFFRELVEPLIPFSFYEKFTQATQAAKDSKKKVFRDLIKTLPPSNRETLKVLTFHLNNVTQLSHENRMQVQNLAIVWGPTLMRQEDSTGSDVALGMVQSGQVIEFILQHCQVMF